MALARTAQGARATSGDAFRVMVFVVLIMLAVLGEAGWIVYQKTTSSLEDELKSHILEDFELVRDAYQADGDQGMVGFADWDNKTHAQTAFSFGIFTLDGQHIAGTIQQPPGFVGWGEMELVTPAGTGPILALSEPMGDRQLVIGRSVKVARVVGDAVLQSLAIAGGLIAVAGLATAFFFGRISSRKLRVMADALDEVSRGNSEARVPVGKSGDQIDYVSRQVNAHLDRLSELMATLRHTAIAIAHDLRSPLNRVSILLQDASQAKDKREILAQVETAHKELVGLKGVLDTIMRISRIESSDDTSAFEVSEIAPLLEDLVQTFEPVLEAQRQHIVFRPPSNPGLAIFCDRHMIQQMVVNLIENAERYAGEGARVEVRMFERNGRPVIVVADNGPGIALEKRALVVKPFFRLSPERSSDGTGLGLALVHAIATRHRAIVELADNHPGLRVTITFPPVERFRPPAPQTDSAAAAAENGKKGAPLRARRKFARP